MLWKKKSLEEKIKGKIKSRLSSKAADIINDNLKKCLQFGTKAELPIQIGDSKVGGNPHLPEGLSIPSYNGRRLKFIAQLSCKDFGQIENFPNEGILYFFLDLQENAEEFPNNRGQHKVFYSGKIDSIRLNPMNSDPIPGFAEEKLLPIPYYDIPDSDSYLFKGVNLSEDDKNQLIDIKHGVIPEIVGDGGLYHVDIIPDSQAMHEWVCQHLGIVTPDGVVDWEKLENDEVENRRVKDAIENMQKDWITLFECTLDYLGYTDSWFHIGIHKNDLRARNLENTFIAFVST